MSCGKTVSQHSVYIQLHVVIIKKNPYHENPIELLNILFATIHRGTKGILLFFQKTRTLQSRGVVTLFHLFAIAMYGRNCFDMQH